MTETWRNENWRSSVRTAAMNGPPGNKGLKPKGSSPGNGAVALQRNIGKTEYDRTNLKPLARSLWSLSVAMAHLLDCNDRFSKIKSVKISPDGMLGGRGYIKTIPQMRQEVAEAQEVISSLVDTLHDEVNAPHWLEIKDELPPEDVKVIEEMADDAQDMIDSPSAAVEQQYQEEVVKEASLREAKRLDQEDDPHESLPTDESDPLYAPVGVLPKETGSSRFSNANNIHYRGDLGGPRIDALGPGEGQGPYGSYNRDEDEQPGGEHPNPIFVNEDEYPNDWKGDYSSIYTSDQTWREAHSLRSSLPGEEQIMTPEVEDQPVRRLTASEPIIQFEDTVDDGTGKQVPISVSQFSDFGDALQYLEQTYGELKRVANEWSLSDPETRRDVDDFGFGYGAKGEGLDDSSIELTWWDDFVGPTGE